MDEKNYFFIELIFTFFCFFYFFSLPLEKIKYLLKNSTFFSLIIIMGENGLIKKMGLMQLKKPLKKKNKGKNFGTKWNGRISFFYCLKKRILYLFLG